MDDFSTFFFYLRAFCSNSMSIRVESVGVLVLDFKLENVIFKAT